MNTYYITLYLKSDTTFGCGSSLSSLVDTEIEYDDYGLPFLHGRTLKGLLVEECANIIYSLKLQEKIKDKDEWYKAALYLFGQPGCNDVKQNTMNVDHARLPEDFRQAVIYAIKEGEKERNSNTFTPIDVIEALTYIRHQTAISPYGVPLEGSLRSTRVLMRGLSFESQLTFTFEKPEKHSLWLLAASVSSLKRVGTNRNRGYGEVEALLSDQPLCSKELAKQFTYKLINEFAQELNK